MGLEWFYVLFEPADTLAADRLYPGILEQNTNYKGNYLNP